MIELHIAQAVDLLAPTGGDGLWSKNKRMVRITGFEILGYKEDGEIFGAELRVHFDRRTWNPREHGLIYTDKKFIKSFIQSAAHFGFTENNTWYSEQGMQGIDYVSFDIELDEHMKGGFFHDRIDSFLDGVEHEGQID